MKSVQLAVLLLIGCISCAEALRCNHCVPYSVGGSCTNSVKECNRGDYVCIYAYKPGHYFKRCSKRSDALILDSSTDLNVIICETDRCN